MRIHHFAAGEGAAKTHEVEPGERLADLLVPEEDEKMFVVGEEIELDVTVTIEAALAGRHGHVTVGYAGADKVVRVHPAARLREVRKLAIAAFEIGQSRTAPSTYTYPSSGPGRQDSTTSSPPCTRHPAETAHTR
jgi:hypothetical protein